MLRIGIVAGEISGDMLAADLVVALRQQRQDLEITGIGGPRLIAAGCRSLYPMEKLAVMGIGEVLRRFPELWKIRRGLRDHFLSQRPDIFIGVDAPDFNFPLERALRGAGIKTIHYVSPSVWAWREYRLRTIARCVDLMLTLFPFENALYEKYHIPVTFVGHPLARKIPLQPDKFRARQKLGLPQDKTVIALFPGSRQGELEMHSGIFLEAAAFCCRHRTDLAFAGNLVDERAREYFAEHLKLIDAHPAVSLYTGQALDVMEAADVVLLASGTAALEAMLLQKPMVVGHKVNWLTWQIARRMVRLPYVSLPNILAGRRMVPECLQHDCTPENLGREILNWLQPAGETQKYATECRRLHQSLCAGSDAILADAVLRVAHAAT